MASPHVRSNGAAGQSSWSRPPSPASPASIPTPIPAQPSTGLSPPHRFQTDEHNTSSLVPFEYEGRQIRFISDELGDPGFVAADLLASHTLNRKALERLDADEMGVSSIHTPGG